MAADLSAAGVPAISKSSMLCSTIETSTAQSTAYANRADEPLSRRETTLAHGINRELNVHRVGAKAFERASHARLLLPQQQHPRPLSLLKQHLTGAIGAHSDLMRARRGHAHTHPQPDSFSAFVARLGRKFCEASIRSSSAAGTGRECK